MFDPAWTSIAMGNGMQELKDRADYVTAENTDDGIMKACLHFGWITRTYPG
jgi:hydroxymethylpyrimidine pyrophosphatase-like HAD family hydrolase